ncbi:hypothetical protein Pint_29673 [Pistacia integerrima]|uniref:Uncharacterized protein n=1 Tax=Pistacia integerrima TaxID=434235 RepID=A0ACC0X205_9ROSI|nr:hypothetical protein Pint_29673 [Pistacia integerrima]
MQLTYWTMAFYIVFDLLSILFTIPNFNAIGHAFMLCGLQEIKQRECEQEEERNHLQSPFSIRKQSPVEPPWKGHGEFKEGNGANSKPSQRSFH